MDGVAPAVGNAILDACGANLVEIPATPERVWNAIKDRKKEPGQMNSNQVYVIGHVNPDTDSIASAIGYAWLLRERDGMNSIAARAGAINPQTAWVLKHLGLEAPVLLTHASPKFSSVMCRLDTVLPDQPLSDAWVIASRTGGVTPVLNSDGTIFGLITSGSLFQFLLRELGVAQRKRDLKSAT